MGRTDILVMFRQELADQFQVLSTKIGAHDELYACHQGWFASIMDFCGYFHLVVVKLLNMSEEDKVHLSIYKLALNQRAEIVTK